MDIIFTHKTQNAFREYADLEKRVQVSAESVVPDVNEDIGRVASVQTQLYLKSKELTARGVTATGEMETVLLYITENENQVSYLTLHRDFSLDFDLGDYPAELEAQIQLAVSNTEARVLNPRKVAVTVEILGSLCCYCRAELPVESELPEEGRALLHCRESRREITMINSVCEKSFVGNEQFLFPEGNPQPEQLLSHHAEFVVEDLQQVGSRVVIKGAVNLDVSYLPQGLSYPVTAHFSTPFSQIVDTGAEECEAGSAFAVVTSAYYDLVDTISGAKALDAEVHAVLQLVSRSRIELRWISDAYSNRYPVTCKKQAVELAERAEGQSLRLNGEDTVSIAEDCEKLLWVYPALAQVQLREEGITAVIGMDVVYARQSGEISSVRRQMELSGEKPAQVLRICSSRLLNTNFRQEGNDLRCRLSVELETQLLSKENVERIHSVTVEEENAYSQDSLPALILVRAYGEELWNLAKCYHSSEEAILHANDPMPPEGGLLLIPRET